MNIDFGKALSFAFERLKNNPLFYILGGLIIFGINFFFSLIGNIFSFVFTFAVKIIIRVLNLNAEIANLLSSVVISLGSVMIGMLLGFIIAPFLVGFCKGVKKEYEGQEAEIGDIFSSFNIFIPCMLNYGLATVIVFSGILLCIVPYFLLMPMLPLTLYFLAQGEVNGGIEPVKKAFDTLKSNPILILWFYVSAFIGFMGVLLCCVGIFVTLPMATAIMYVIIAQALGNDPASSAVKIENSDSTVLN